jgi:RNA polymerase sigma factor (sigma-70 family)
MKKRFEELLARMGLRHEAGVHRYEVDASLYAAVAEQAEKEKITPDELANDLVRTELAKRQKNEVLRNRWDTLSVRGQDVTALTCLGYTNRQIAAKLGISEETVKTHVKRALKKFKMHGKLELQIALKKWDFSEWDK